jgi:amidophosphoribosyltransferase
MEKQHNRGQDGAGFASIKFDVEPGERYISRVRSNDAQPIQDVFQQINERINEELPHPEYGDDVASKSKYSIYRRIVFRTRSLWNFWKKQHRKCSSVFASKQLDAPKPDFAGNFNMTNVKELFDSLVEIGQHPKEMKIRLL